LAELRVQLGLTLEQAAGRSDLDLKHLQNIESGQINVTIVTLILLSVGLRQPIAVRFGAGLNARPSAATRGASGFRKKPGPRPPAHVARSSAPASGSSLTFSMLKARFCRFASTGQSRKAGQKSRPSAGSWP
jgi:transcriptional regulator with XRE-family HTH domain